MIRRSKWWIIGGVGCLTLVVGLLFGAGQWLYLSDPPQKTDAIVCLGGGDGRRWSKAIDLFNRGLAPKVLVTATEFNKTDFSPYFFKALQQYFIEKGVPTTATTFNTQSRSTFDEARYVYQFAQDHHIQSLTVVSDPYHLRRVKFIFEKVFQTYPITFAFVPADWDTDPFFWWKDRVDTMYVINELIKNIGYRVVYATYANPSQH